MDALGPLIPILLLVAVFWLLVLRPARTRQRAQQATVSRMQIGSEVMTSGGLFATVTALPARVEPTSVEPTGDDVQGDVGTGQELGRDQVEIEISPGVRVRFLAAAIARVVEVHPTTTTADESSEEAPQHDTTAR